jgi:hypothetical protein
VLDLAAPVAEPSMRASTARTASAPRRAVEDEEGIGERRDEVDVQLVGAPTRLAGDRRQPVRAAASAAALRPAGRACRRERSGRSPLERVDRERRQQVEALEMRRAAEARLQMRPMRPAQQLEGAARSRPSSRAMRAASSSSAPSSAGRQAAPARSAAATSQGRPSSARRRRASAGRRAPARPPRLEEAGHLGMELARDRRRHRARAASKIRSWAKAPSRSTCAASSSLQASLRSIARRPST